MYINCMAIIVYLRALEHSQAARQTELLITFQLLLKTQYSFHLKIIFTRTLDLKKIIISLWEDLEPLKIIKMDIAFLNTRSKWDYLLLFANTKLFIMPRILNIYFYLFLFQIAPLPVIKTWRYFKHTLQNKNLLSFKKKVHFYIIITLFIFKIRKK